MSKNSGGQEVSTSSDRKEVTPRALHFTAATLSSSSPCAHPPNFAVHVGADVARPCAHNVVHAAFLTKLGIRPWAPSSHDAVLADIGPSHDSRAGTRWPDARRWWRWRCVMDARLHVNSEDKCLCVRKRKVSHAVTVVRQTFIPQSRLGVRRRFSPRKNIQVIVHWLRFCLCRPKTGRR